MSGRTTTHDGWANNWRVIAPPATRQISIPARRSERARAVTEARRLPAGTTVALVCDGVGAGRRTIAFARAARIRIRREFVAFPSARRPAFLVEAADPTVEYFFARQAFVPPGVSTLAGAGEVVLRLVRGARRWSTVAAAVPARLSLGVRE